MQIIKATTIRDLGPSRVAIFIIIFTCFNGLFNSLASSFGYGFPHNTFYLILLISLRI